MCLQGEENGGVCSIGQQHDSAGEAAGHERSRALCLEGYQLHVIDVNYFPSYNSPGAAVHVWQALLDQVAPAAISGGHPGA